MTHEGDDIKIANLIRTRYDAESRHEPVDVAAGLADLLRRAGTTGIVRPESRPRDVDGYAGRAVPPNVRPPTGRSRSETAASGGRPRRRGRRKTKWLSLGGP